MVRCQRVLPTLLLLVLLLALHVLQRSQRSAFAVCAPPSSVRCMLCAPSGNVAGKGQRRGRGPNTSKSDRCVLQRGRGLDARRFSRCRCKANVPTGKENVRVA